MFNWTKFCASVVLAFFMAVAYVLPIYLIAFFAFTDSTSRLYWLVFMLFADKCSTWSHSVTGGFYDDPASASPPR